MSNKKGITMSSALKKNKNKKNVCDNPLIRKNTLRKSRRAHIRIEASLQFSCTPCRGLKTKI